MRVTEDTVCVATLTLATLLISQRNNGGAVLRRQSAGQAAVQCTGVVGGPCYCSHGHASLLNRNGHDLSVICQKLCFGHAQEFIDIHCRKLPKWQLATLRPIKVPTR